MELRHLRYFLAVAEEGHFTRAAFRLGIGQPPLSQQIKDLEEHIGTKLFIRHSRGADLTPAGHAFRSEAEAILQATDRACDIAQRAGMGQFGQLALGFTGSASFTELVRAAIQGFKSRWPDVKLDLTEVNSVRLLDLLRRGDLDAAFIRPGALDPEGITLLRAPDEAMLVALPFHHPLAAQDTVSLADLAGEPMVLFPRRAGLSLYDEISAAFHACGIEPKVVQEVPQMASVINLVAADLGVSIVTRSMSHIRLPSVVYRPIYGVAPVARIALARLSGAPNPVVQNLWGMMHELLDLQEKI